MPFLDVKTLVNPLTNFVTLHNTGNGASNATNINNAIAAASASGGGVLWFDPGVWPISTQIVPANNVTLFCYDVTWRWTGVTLFMLGNTSAAVLQNFNIFGLTLDGQGLANITAIAIHSPQYCTFREIVILSTQVAIQILADVPFVSNPPYNENAALNLFDDIRINVCAAGIILQGTSASQVVTLNSFRHIMISNCNTYGINCVQWCDSNSFYNIWISLIANNTQGVIQNSGAPASNVGVYQNDFYGLFVDAFTLTGIIAVLLNFCSQIVIRNLECSPDPFSSGSVLTTANNPASYIVESANTPPQTFVLGYTTSGPQQFNASGINAAQTNPANAATINTGGFFGVRFAPTGAVTGLILAQPNPEVYQELWIINESAANTLSWNATDATSHVLGAAGSTIAVSSARLFIYSPILHMWIRTS